MRRRLARSMTTLVVVSVLLVSIPTFVFGVLFLYVLGDNITNVTADSLAAAGARAVHEQAGGASDYDASVLGAGIPPDMYVIITDPPNKASASTTPQSSYGVERVHPYGKVTHGFAWNATAQVGNGPTVRVWLNSEWAIKTVAGLALTFVVLGVVAILIARVVARRMARKFTEPLEEFAATAEAIGQGDPTITTRRYGMPELDRVAEVLDTGVAYTYDLLERERRLSAEVGHQLRTPLTAIALRLDEIVSNSNDSKLVEAEGRAAQEHVMRLADVVDEVIATVRNQPPRISRVELADVCNAVLYEWERVFAGKRRELVVEGNTTLEAAASRATTLAVLSTLVENSLSHGAGTTTITVRSQSSWVVIEVGDEGDGVPPGLNVFAPGVSGAGSSGLGLATARTMMDGMGGRLELVSQRPAVFGAFLPGIETLSPDGDDQAVIPAPATQQ